jgi:hypothetical protein
MYLHYLNMWKNYFSQLLSVHAVKQTAGPLVLGP